MSTIFSILIADENRKTLMLTRSLLRRDGHTITTSGDGRSAFDLCKSNIFTMIILSVTLPKLSGITALKAIKKLSNLNSQCPVIALTDNSDPLNLETLGKVGFDGILCKPVSLKSINILLRNYTNFNTPMGSPQSLPYSDSMKHAQHLVAPILDQKIVRVLHSMFTKAQLKIVLRNFWQETQAMVTSLNEARFTQIVTVDDNLHKIHKTAKQLSISTANLGLNRLSLLAQSLQYASLNETAFLIESINESIEASKHEILETLDLNIEETFKTHVA